MKKDNCKLRFDCSKHVGVTGQISNSFIQDLIAIPEDIVNIAYADAIASANKRLERMNSTKEGRQIAVFIFADKL